MRVKRIVYYKELSKIINENINLMRFCNRKNNGILKYYYYMASNKLINNYFDNGRISCDAYEYFLRRVYNCYWL
mgnify:CR=1 FL=1